MHIIKISPDSFKVILSKSDMEKYRPSAFDGSVNSKKMLNHILTILQSDEKSPAGSIAHAEFFEDKFGGGELFLRLGSSNRVPSRYIFSCTSIEDIIAVCRLIASKFPGVSSRLFSVKGIYKLAVFSKFPLPHFTEAVGEFGTAVKASKADIWLAEEHGKVIIKCRAVEVILEKFGLESS